MPKKKKAELTEAQIAEYRKIDPLWGTQMPCWVCSKCSCMNCHPKGPCIPIEIPTVIVLPENKSVA